MPHRKLAVKLEPASWSYGALANTLLYLNRHAEASEAYQKTIELGSTSAINWSCWGLELCASGKAEEGLKKCQRAIEMEPKNAVCWYNYGLAFASLKRFQEAIEKYRKVCCLSWKWTITEIRCIVRGYG